MSGKGFAASHHMPWFFSHVRPFKYCEREWGQVRVRRKKHFLPVLAVCLETWRLKWKLNHTSMWSISYSGIKKFYERKITSQAILSLIPTFCHVFITIIEQNLCHNRLISWMTIPRVGKIIRPCVSAINRVLQQPAHGWLLGEKQKWAALTVLCPREHLSRAHWKKQKAWDERPLLCGVVGLRGLSHPFATGQGSGSQGKEDITSIIMMKGC